MTLLQVVVLHAGRVVEQGKPAHNVALLHAAADDVAVMQRDCDAAGDPRVLAAAEGSAFGQLLAAVGGGA